MQRDPGRPDPFGSDTNRAGAPRGAAALLAPDIRGLRVRGLDAGDAPLLHRHLLRLGPADRRARFHGAVADEAVATYVGRIDWRHSYVFGAHAEGDLRAVAEMVLAAPRRPGGAASEAEVALSVEPAFQHHGLGKLLLLAALLAGRHLHLKRLHLSWLPSNGAMRALIADMGGIAAPGSGVIEGMIPVPPTLPS